MNKLTKQQAKEWETAQAALVEAGQEIDAAREAFEAALLLVVQEHLPRLATAVEGWHNAAQDVAAVRDDITSAMDDYASDRSEDWAEGATGSQFESWKSTWEGLDLDQGGEDALELIFQAVQEAVRDQDIEVPEIPVHDDVLSALDDLALTREEA